MHLVHLADLPWTEWHSPGRVFEGFGRQVSDALGAKRDAHLLEGGHPFDLEYGRLKPGKSGCPFHSHATQWELFIIATGTGQVRDGGATHSVKAGDAVLHPAGGEAHQLINTGTNDLEYYLIADNPTVDVWHYPDSNKWGFRPRGGIFRRTDVDYFLDEDNTPQPTKPPRVVPPVPEALRARFVWIEAIPEEEQRSPGGRHGSYKRDISLALGGIRDVGTWGGGHPFDVAQRRVPPGLSVCPYHAHQVQWELFVALSGEATVRSNDEQHTVRAGDAFLQPPGVAHKITNTGVEDFIFYVIADNPQGEITYYPDSGKWMHRPGRKIFRMQETDYFDGEE